ncbi:hypothetical protein H0H81_006392 [Sphagnurus paluster]|uniref:Uncharacterized protein n=1 Tax=Sphagnurus paluster TaxID=117069 RepID=A0A9P7GLC8_9AGAR|nr:hypothetical protein H0H81_006392 [Sphagnurus paluster]
MSLAHEKPNSSECVHLMSKRAEALRHNVFVWCSYRRQIQLSWRLDEPVTVKTMYQWIDTAITWDVDNGGGDPKILEYTLFPIKVKHGESALRYDLHPKAPELSRSSKDHVTVGSFGMYKTTGAILRNFSTSRGQVSLNFLVRLFEHDPKFACLVEKPPPALVQAALARDKSCIFTGNPIQPENAQVIWVIPLICPYLMVRPFDNCVEYDRLLGVEYGPERADFLKNIHNCLVTTPEIAKLLYENLLTVDAEDNYKIYYFGERSVNTPIFKKYLEFYERNNERDSYLQAHFRHSLRTRIIGGDAIDDFGDVHELERFIDSREEKTSLIEANFSLEDKELAIVKLILKWNIMKDLWAKMGTYDGKQYPRQAPAAD